MAYVVEPIDVTSTPKEKVVDPRSKKTGPNPTPFTWWLAQNDRDLMSQLLSTTEYLKRTNSLRVRQASIFTRLFCGKPLYNYLSSNNSMDASNQLPIGRPTANVTYSCIDTLSSRIGQEKPLPVFQTEGSNFNQRKLTEQANQFIIGEFFRTKAYQKGQSMFRNACVLGDGLIKVYKKHNKVHSDVVLDTELLTDYNDAYYGNPRQLIQMKLVDRFVFRDMFPKKAHLIDQAQAGHVDTTPRSNETISDQFIIAEGWHLESGDDAGDGRHSIVCSAGVLLDETSHKKKFPFVKMGYNPGIVGWHSQSLTEILMPTQMELYRQLIIASQSLELNSVPRIFIEEMSNILETSFNNRIGGVIKYRNTPPIFHTAQSNHPEVYQFIQWLIGNAYQIAGISEMSAQGQKSPGLVSGEAIRKEQETQQGRFAALSRRYHDVYPELAELYIDVATDIYKETGAYTTIYPGKDGIAEVDFKSIKMLKDSFVIQCYEQNFLPLDPAGRQAKLSEMFAAQEITRQEFRRMSRMPDLEQSDQLAIALEERILKQLDAIVHEGKKAYAENAPDPFILDPEDLATKLCVNYINKYAVTNLDEERQDLLKTYFNQVQDLKKQAMPPQPIQNPDVNSPLPVQPPQPSVSPISGVTA